MKRLRHRVAPSMRIEIWSDVVCPWCAIGKAHLDAALADFEHAGEVEVVWRSFELDPGAPPVREGDYVEILARKYGTTPAGAKGMVDQMTSKAAAAGLDFSLDRARPGNSFDAHRLVHMGAERGRQTQVKERLLQAYLSEGAAIGERQTLENLAVELGFDPVEVRAVLASDAYADAVRADEAEGLELEITGVPLFLVDRRFAIPGAQPADVILQTLRRAWDEGRRPVTVTGDGDACGPDGCAP
jgi:predicted DsbA family dithiol-disulfide isomerase